MDFYWNSKYTYIPDGSFVLGIEGYGVVELFADNCVDTDKTPQMTLSQTDAARFLLGSIPIYSSCKVPENLDERTRNYIQSVFPLPLWWCNQDRV